MHATLPAGLELDVYKRLPLTLVHGEGVWVTDDTGRVFLDLYGGHATALLGYAHPVLLETLSDQARALFFQTNAVDVPVRARAAAALGALFPDALSRVFFVNSGAEANENALRMAFKKTGRTAVVALEGCFHGRTAAASALTWGSERWYAYPRTPFDVRHVPVDAPAAMRAAIDDDVAAVILEPVQGVAGALPVPEAVIRAAREACDATGAVLISDEIQCGLGRTGHSCAMVGAGAVPDLVTLGKGLAGGFPCAAVVATESLASAIQPGDLGTTFGGGPMATALVEAVATLVRRQELPERAAQAHTWIRERCVVGPVTGVRGAGLLVGLHTTPPAAEVAAALRDQGILVGTSADPHVLRLMPPLTLESAHVDQLAAALEAL